MIEITLYENDRSDGSIHEHKNTVMVREEL